MSHTPLGARGPLPFPGVPDLGAFRGLDTPTAAQAQRESLASQLRAQGMLCSCGEKIGAEAIMVVGYLLGRFPQIMMGPQGPVHQLVDSAKLYAQTFHSHDCPHYRKALADGLGSEEGLPAATVLLERPIPATHWLSEPPLPAPAPPQTSSE